jgi:circadian clock protein KaiC
MGVSHVSDNVVVLQYLRQRSEVRRTLTVLKTRASLHQPRVREFTITPEGITLENELPTDPEPSAQPSPTEATAVERSTH